MKFFVFNCGTSIRLPRATPQNALCQSRAARLTVFVTSRSSLRPASCRDDSVFQEDGRSARRVARASKPESGRLHIGATLGRASAFAMVVAQDRPAPGQKTKGSERVLAAPIGVYPPQVFAGTESYWLSGLKVRTPASVLEQTPAGSTRTTASSSAQKPRMPVWLIESGTETTV